jgi:hypothetical protein
MAGVMLNLGVKGMPAPQKWPEEKSSLACDWYVIKL